MNKEQWDKMDKFDKEQFLLREFYWEVQRASVSTYDELKPYMREFIKANEHHYIKDNKQIKIESGPSMIPG